MPYPLVSSAMAQSPDEKGVLLFGGMRTNTGYNMYAILELRAGATSWNVLDITMEYARSGHVVIPLK